MDDQLWWMAAPIATGRGAQRAIELDFLRAIHQKAALDLLAVHLGQVLGSPVRLMSIWLDKFGWASWTDSTGALVASRELADMGIVVRRRHPGGIAKWMWLLQAKRTTHLAQKYKAPYGSSTWYEQDLLHEMPPFYLWDGNPTKAGASASLGPFDLQQDFGASGLFGSSGSIGGVAAVPWTFLDFDADIKHRRSAKKRGFPPIAARWVGARALRQNSWAAGWQQASGSQTIAFASYVDCLAAIAGGPSVDWWYPWRKRVAAPRFWPGAPVHPIACPEWWALYRALMRYSLGAKSGHAISTGNVEGSVIQFSRTVAGTSRDATLAALRQQQAVAGHVVQWLTSVRPMGGERLQRNSSGSMEADWSVANVRGGADLAALEAFDDALLGDDGNGTGFHDIPPGTKHPFEDGFVPGGGGVGQWLFVDVIEPRG